jgi:Uma2 family endonuclease
MATVSITPPAVLPSIPIRLADEPLYEVINGERRQIEPMGVYAGTLASLLSQIMGPFASANRLGLVVVEVLFQLSAVGPLQRRPDLAFVAFDRMSDPIFPNEDPAVWAVIPNLAVEVVRPTNTALQIEDKLDDYFRHDVQLVWVIYPKHRIVHVYDARTSCRVLTENDDLEGGSAVPGFRLKIGNLFAAVTQPR